MPAGLTSVGSGGGTPVLLRWLGPVAEMDGRGALLVV